VDFGGGSRWNASCNSSGHCRYKVRMESRQVSEIGRRGRYGKYTQYSTNPQVRLMIPPTLHSPLRTTHRMTMLLVGSVTLRFLACRQCAESGDGGTTTLASLLGECGMDGRLNLYLHVWMAEIPGPWVEKWLVDTSAKQSTVSKNLKCQLATCAFGVALKRRQARIGKGQQKLSAPRQTCCGEIP
jgi:hypothetical protein